ncbi:MAG: helix-turn-helix transcriptional regulator [Candidatus Eremiobacteraeota bacterium]|nr:helix-turn-helix transcriptional regulator [Candidatus Eremiobacteraeota bacterium]MCW5872381.1 helix-turn-helix transcriptional regulator [Candidatus Eremiobacteraeota bacterium]
MPNSGVFLVGVKRLRLAKNWTQKELGERIGKSANAVYRYERRRCNPRGYLLRALSRALDCEIWELFFDPGLSEAA